MEDKRKRMEELVARLNRAGRAYYQESRELISNQEYDELYDELQRLETETGIVLANSPTVHVGYEVIKQYCLRSGMRVAYAFSGQDKRSGAAAESSLGDKKAMISWKLDGLTIVLTYRDGKLAKAVTRGNGEVGEVVYEQCESVREYPSSDSAMKDELDSAG